MDVNWIKTAEKLPEENISVLVVYAHANGNKEIFIGKFKGDRWDLDRDYVNLDRVSHWMEIPAMPKEENDEYK